MSSSPAPARADVVASATPVAPAEAGLLDTVHDLLVRLVGDRRDPAEATADVVLRTAGRHRDRVLRRVDRTTVLGVAHTYAVALVAADAGPAAAEATTDLAVLDLIARRGLDARSVARITGVRRRELTARRIAAAGRLAVTAPDGSAATATREYANAPLDPAPAWLRRRVGPALGRATTRRHGRGLLHLAVILVVTVLVLGALAVGTPMLVSLGTGDGPPTSVEAVPADDHTVTPAVDAPPAGDAGEERRPDAGEGAVVLPGDGGEVGAVDEVAPAEG